MYQNLIQSFNCLHKASFALKKESAGRLRTTCSLTSVTPPPPEYLTFFIHLSSVMHFGSLHDMADRRCFKFFVHFMLVEVSPPQYVVKFLTQHKQKGKRDIALSLCLRS